MELYLAGNHSYHFKTQWIELLRLTPPQILELFSFNGIINIWKNLYIDSQEISKLLNHYSGSYQKYYKRMMEVFLSGQVAWRLCLHEGLPAPPHPISVTEQKELAMLIYMAGGYSGNLRPFWDKFAKFIQQNDRNAVINHFDKAMELYLAGNYGSKNNAQAADPKGLQFGSAACAQFDWSGLNILESFFYLRGNTTYGDLIPYYRNFLLDSGAFTFMQGAKGKVDWDGYVEEFAAYINKYDIKRFFELDIDSIVGIKEVERLRSKLEKLTNKQPIPVWHISRGKDYFFQMCDAYKYVAIGGIVTKEIPTKKYEPLFPWFIQEAHKKGCKIHGLGYTNIQGLHKYHFDSVDSTAWLYGNRGGYVYIFNPATGMIEQRRSDSGARLNSREAAVHNFNEWVKFQKYARIKL